MSCLAAMFEKKFLIECVLCLLLLLLFREEERLRPFSHPLLLRFALRMGACPPESPVTIIVSSSRQSKILTSSSGIGSSSPLFLPCGY